VPAAEEVSGGLEEVSGQPEEVSGGPEEVAGVFGELLPGQEKVSAGSEKSSGGYFFSSAGLSSLFASSGFLAPGGRPWGVRPMKRRSFLGKPFLLMIVTHFSYQR
jgi:hypothetical protein